MVYGDYLHLCTWMALNASHFPKLCLQMSFLNGNQFTDSLQTKYWFTIDLMPRYTFVWVFWAYSRDGALLTHVIVSCDGHGGSGTRTLLVKVVAKLEDAGIVLQHGGDLHLNCVAKFLPLNQKTEGGSHLISFAFGLSYMLNIGLSNF